MKKILFIIALFFINQSFCQKDWKAHQKENFSVRYPNKWILDTSGQMNTEFLLFSELTPNDNFRENVNLIIQDLKGQNITLESYAELSNNQITELVKNGKIIERKNKGSHYILVWSGFVAGNNLKFKQYFFVKNEKAYILTFTALQTTFDDYVKKGTEILDTFKINN